MICKDTESYKLISRALLKDWISTVTSASHLNQEWLVVLVSPLAAGSGKTATGIGSRLRASVADRVRSDVNIGKRDRSVASGIYVSTISESYGAYTSRQSGDHPASFPPITRPSPLRRPRLTTQRSFSHSVRYEHLGNEQRGGQDGGEADCGWVEFLALLSSKGESCECTRGNVLTRGCT